MADWLSVVIKGLQDEISDLRKQVDRLKIWIFYLLVALIARSPDDIVKIFAKVVG